MATHSSIPAWRIPWTEEAGRLQSLGLQKVGHDWAHIHTHLIILSHFSGHYRASLVAQVVKNLPAMRETWVWSLDWDDPLEEGMATLTRDVGGGGSIPGSGRSPGVGNGNPLQYSCLENSHGQRSWVDYCPWGCKESDMTEQLSTAHRDCNLWDLSVFWCVMADKHDLHCI